MVDRRKRFFWRGRGGPSRIKRKRGKGRSTSMLVKAIDMIWSFRRHMRKRAYFWCGTGMLVVGIGTWTIHLLMIGFRTFEDSFRRFSCPFNTPPDVDGPRFEIFWLWLIQARFFQADPNRNIFRHIRLTVPVFVIFPSFCAEVLPSPLGDNHPRRSAHPPPPPTPVFRPR